MKLKYISIALYLALTSIIIASPGLYNGYPVMHFDSAHYITQSISLEDASVTPIGYSLFIRAFSWQYTLWPVIFAQGLIISLLIYLVYKSIFQEPNLILHHFISIIVLTFFTGMGWVASYIMADIFTPIAILSLALFLSTRAKQSVKIISLIIIAFACTTHFSNSMIIAGLLIILFLLNFIIRLFPFRLFLWNSFLIIFVLIISFLFIKNYYWFAGQKEKPKSISHILIMARLMETGILDEFLESHCEDNRFTLCYFKDKFPNIPPDFVWTKESPLFKTGGWNYSSEEYNEIIRQVFSDGYYIRLFAYKGLLSTFQQLATFRLTVIDLHDQASLNEIIHTKFKNEEKRFKMSIQHFKDKLDLSLLNTSYHILFGLSLIILALFFYKKYSRTNDDLKFIVVVVILGVILNAAITGTFSNVVNRYQSRVNWLVIFISIMLFQKYFSEIIRFLWSIVTRKSEFGEN